jgi:hypothetical protein
LAAAPPVSQELELPLLLLELLDFADSLDSASDPESCEDGTAKCGLALRPDDRLRL